MKFYELLFKFLISYVETKDEPSPNFIKFVGRFSEIIHKFDIIRKAPVVYCFDDGPSDVMISVEWLTSEETYLVKVNYSKVHDKSIEFTIFEYDDCNFEWKLKEEYVTSIDGNNIPEKLLPYIKTYI